jgi:hypothetical protein
MTEPTESIENIRFFHSEHVVETPVTCSECSDYHDDYHDDYNDDYHDDYEQNIDDDNHDNQNNFVFNQDEEYIFVNQMLNLLNGHTHLPSYAYYDSNSRLNNFWNSLDTEDFILIYDYLVNRGYIVDDDTLDDEQVRYHVLAFVRSYFISTNNDD